jgi:signal peptidase II
MINSKSIIRIVLILSVISANIGCDQVSKKMVRDNISTDENIRLLSNHLIITRLENTGAFLSMGDSLSKPIRNILLALLPLLALSIGFVYILTKSAMSLASLYGSCFIIGGGVGNIFDRIAHGSVTDFLYIHFGMFHTGVFNLADTSIMTGSFIIILHYLIKSRQKQSLSQ